jgi:hypothetical protein
VVPPAGKRGGGATCTVGVGSDVASLRRGVHTRGGEASSKAQDPRATHEWFRYSSQAP